MRFAASFTRWKLSLESAKLLYRKRSWHLDRLVLLLIEAENCITHGDDSSTFLQRLRSNPAISPVLHEPDLGILRKFLKSFKISKQSDWDQIWCRIVKNHFASQTIRNVSYIVGNPPWVRWSRLPRSYRARCKSFCNYYGLVSGRGYAGGIESDISTVILIRPWTIGCGWEVNSLF